MLCLHCSKNIGLVRRLVDRQFCSDAHRRKAQLVYSARAVRDYAYDEAYEDGWIARATAPPKRKSASFGPGTGVLLVALTTVMVMLLPSMGQRSSSPRQSFAYTPPSTTLGSKLSGLFQNRPSISLREDFRLDLRNWQGAADSWNGGWQQVGKAVRVGELRLWKPTLPLADYNMEFLGEIESRAMGWAFRATDHSNYYATKISVSGTKNSPRAEIIRYAVTDGKHSSKVQLPIPLSVVTGMVYNVKVRVRGDRFMTMVNGQVVDAWGDQRLKRGGIGFFNDPGERASLRWVAVAERESFLQRFLSFSFFVHPGALEMAGQSRPFDIP